MSSVTIYGAGGEPVSSSAPVPHTSAAVHTDPKGDPYRLSPTEMPLPVAENARQAGCYQFVGEHWSVDEHHKELTSAIRREADPRYVPLLCKRIYLSPAGTEITRTYHVVGRHIPFPTDEYKDSAIHLSTVPRGFPFPPDQIHPLRTLWAPWDTQDEEGRFHHPVEYSNNTPPEEVQIGPWLLEQMCALRKFFDSSILIDGEDVRTGDFQTDKLAQILEAQTLADAKRMDTAREEARYRMRHNWRQVKDALDNERWAPEPPEAAKFLDLGKKG